MINNSPMMMQSPQPGQQMPKPNNQQFPPQSMQNLPRHQQPMPGFNGHQTAMQAPVSNASQLPPQQNLNQPGNFPSPMMNGQHFPQSPVNMGQNLSSPMMQPPLAGPPMQTGFPPQSSSGQNLQNLQMGNRQQMPPTSGGPMPPTSFNNNNQYPSQNMPPNMQGAMPGPTPGNMQQRGFNQYPATSPMGNPQQYPTTSMNQQQFPPTSPMGAQQYPTSPMGSMGAPPPQRRLDPDQMPNPIQVMTDNQRTNGGVFITNQPGLLPPLVTTKFTTHDQGNTNPRLLRSSMYSVPATSDMMKQSAVPFSLVISPFARLAEQEMQPPIVNMGEVGPIRCVRCKAYMSPYMQFIDAGRRFQCLLCKAVTEGEIFHQLEIFKKKLFFINFSTC